MKIPSTKRKSTVRQQIIPVKIGVKLPVRRKNARRCIISQSRMNTEFYAAFSISALASKNYYVFVLNVCLDLTTDGEKKTLELF